MKLLEYMNEKDRNKLKKSMEKWREKADGNELWADFHHFPTLINHGHFHVQNIYKNIEKLLEQKFSEDKEFLSSKEIFYLISATWLHDIGCRGKGKDEEWEERRKKHSIQSQAMLEKSPAKYLLSPEEAGAAGFISAYHSKKAPLTERHLEELKAKGKNLTDKCIEDGMVNGEKIRFKLLAAILQLCDACDRQKSRFRQDKVLLLTEAIEKKAEDLRNIEAKLIKMRDSDNEKELMLLERLEEKLIRDLKFLVLQYEKKYMLSIEETFIENDKIVILKNSTLKWSEENHMKNLELTAGKIREDLDLANEVLENYGLNIKNIEIR